MAGIPWTLTFLSHASPDEPGMCEEEVAVTFTGGYWECIEGEGWRRVDGESVSYTIKAQASAQSNVTYGYVYVNCPGKVSTPCPEDTAVLTKYDPDTCCSYQCGCVQLTIDCSSPTVITVRTDGYCGTGDCRKVIRRDPSGTPGTPCPCTPR